MRSQVGLIIATATLSLWPTPAPAQPSVAVPQQDVMPQLPIDPPPSICETYGYTTYDMVEWIVQTYPGADTSYLGPQNPGPIADLSRWDSVRQRFYRVRDTVGGNEVYDYDDNYIYLRRETINNSPTDFLLYTNNYIWAPRYAITANTAQHQPCFRLETSATSTEYVGCQVVGSGGVTFAVVVSGPFTLTLGGDVGTVQALKLAQTNLNVFESESYWYAKPYGLVYYERRSANGTLLGQETLNRIYTPEPRLDLSCGIGY